MPDVAVIRRLQLEAMDLRCYGIRPVFMTKHSRLWSVDGRPELCLTVDEALAAVGFCAIWTDGTVTGGLRIEPWG